MWRTDKEGNSDRRGAAKVRNPGHPNIAKDSRSFFLCEERSTILNKRHVDEKKGTTHNKSYAGS